MEKSFFRTKKSRAEKFEAQKNRAIFCDSI
jgi:hypothetical protein